MATDLYDVGLGLDSRDLVAGADKATAALVRVGEAATRVEKATAGLGASWRQTAAGVITLSRAEEIVVKDTNAVTHATQGAHSGLGKVEHALKGMAMEALGATGHLSSLGFTLAQFATGTGTFLAITAGIAAIGVVWEKVTEESRAAKKAAEEYMNSPAVREQLDADRRRAGLATSQDKTAESVRTALRNVGAASDIAGNDMITTSLRGLRELRIAFADDKIAADEFLASVTRIGAVAKQVGADALTKATDEALKLGSALESATREAEHHAKEIHIAGLSEHELAEHAKKLREEFEKFGKAAEERRQKVDALHAEMISTTSLVEKLGAVYENAAKQQEHLKETTKALHDELAKKTAMADEITSIGEQVQRDIRKLYEGDLEAKKRAGEAALEPFKNALHGAQEALSDFFSDVLRGGTSTFKQLADGIRTMFARLAAELISMRIMQRVAGVASMGLGAPGSGNGGISDATAAMGGGGWGSYLGAAGGAAGIGYGIGSMTSNRGLGALGGAVGGAAIGTMIMPGIGTAIGAVVGGIAGIFGSAARRHAEERKRAEHEAQAAIIRGDAEVRSLQAQGRTYAAESARLELDHQRELNDLGKQGFDGATTAAVLLAQAAETAALAADQALRRQQEAAERIRREGELFGESDAATRARLGELYGFGGMSRQDILKLYTRYTPGGPDLTADERARNQAIEDFLAAGGAGGVPGSNTRVGGVTSVSSSQADMINGLLTSSNVWLSKIAYNTETLRSGVGGASTVGFPTGGADGIDRLLGTAAMKRRAAVGAPRG